MIEFPYKVREREVFVRCSTNPEEEYCLKTLLSEIKTICSIVGNEGRTGLRVIKELTTNGWLCAIFSLNHAVLLNEGELESIRQEIIYRQ